MGGAWSTPQSTPEPELKTSFYYSHPSWYRQILPVLGRGPVPPSGVPRTVEHTLLPSPWALTSKCKVVVRRHVTEALATACMQDQGVGCLQAGRGGGVAAAKQWERHQWLGVGKGTGCAPCWPLHTCRTRVLGAYRKQVVRQEEAEPVEQEGLQGGEAPTIYMQLCLFACSSKQIRPTLPPTRSHLEVSQGVRLLELGQEGNSHNSAPHTHTSHTLFTPCGQPRRPTA